MNNIKLITKQKFIEMMKLYYYLGKNNTPDKETLEDMYKAWEELKK